MESGSCKNSSLFEIWSLPRQGDEDVLILEVGDRLYIHVNNYSEESSIFMQQITCNQSLTGRGLGHFDTHGTHHFPRTILPYLPAHTVHTGEQFFSFSTMR